MLFPEPELEADQDGPALAEPEPPVQAPNPSIAQPLRGPGYREQRLAELDLKYGATHVYRIGRLLYAHGDFAHSPAEDIEYNMRRLVTMLKQHPGANQLSKDFDCGLYFESSRLNLEKITETARQYRATVYALNSDGEIIGEAADLGYLG